MKTYQLLILIVLAALVQTSTFYINLGGFGVRWILIIAWVLYLNYSRDDAFYFAFFSGLLVDLLRLEGIGITSFSMLLPLLVFFALDLSVKLKDSPLKYIALLLGIVFSHVLLVMMSFIFGDIAALDSSFIGTQITIIVVEWLIVSVFTGIREIFFPEFIKYS